MLYRPALAASCLALIMAASTGPARAMTVDAYLDLAKRKEATNSLDRYMDGLRDGVLDYNAAMLSAGIKVFCPPEGKAPLGAAELRTRIETWLRGSQKTGVTFAEYAKSTTLGLVALEVLNDLYACPDEREDEGMEEGAGAPR